MEESFYRPRNAGHDYYGRGTYLITLVVSGRERLLSRFVTEIGRKMREQLFTATHYKGDEISATPVVVVACITWTIG